MRNQSLAKAYPVSKEKGPNGRNLCRKCHKEVPAGRTAWCSEECQDEVYTLVYWSHARHKAFMRDRGTCLKCGLDTDYLESFLLKVRSLDKELQTLTAINLKKMNYNIITPTRFGRMYYGHLFEIDHIIPCIEGGDNRLENLRTLCIPCHKRGTKELAGRRAEKRKKEKLFGEGSLFAQ